MFSGNRIYKCTGCLEKNEFNEGMIRNEVIDSDLEKYKSFYVNCLKCSKKHVIGFKSLA